MKADLDDGYTRIANDLLEALSRCDLTARQFRVMLAVIRKTYGWKKKVDWMTATNIAEAINYQGASTHINADIRALSKRKMIVVEGKNIGPNASIIDWVQTEKEPKTVRKVTENGQKKSDRNQSEEPKAVTKETENGHFLESEESDRKRSKEPKMVRGVTENGQKKEPKTVTTKDKKETITKEKIYIATDSKKCDLVKFNQMREEFPELTEQTAKDWLTVRKTKKAPLTQTAWNGAVKQIRISGLTGEEAIHIAAERGWAGIKAEWLANHLSTNQNNQANKPGTLHNFEEVNYGYGVGQDGSF